MTVDVVFHVQDFSSTSRWMEEEEGQEEFSSLEVSQALEEEVGLRCHSPHLRPVLASRQADRHNRQEDRLDHHYNSICCRWVRHSMKENTTSNGYCGKCLFTWSYCLLMMWHCSFVRSLIFDRVLSLFPAAVLHSRASQNARQTSAALLQYCSTGDAQILLAIQRHLCGVQDSNGDTYVFDLSTWSNKIAETAAQPSWRQNCLCHVIISFQLQMCLVV